MYRMLMTIIEVQKSALISLHHTLNKLGVGTGIVI